MWYTFCKLSRREAKTLRELNRTVPADYDGRPIKHFLRGELGISSTLLKTLKWREGAITRNGESVHVNAPLRTGDLVRVRLDERAPRERDVPPLALPLDVVYEDEDLLVLNKPAGLAMHPMSTDLAAPSLAGALVAYLGEGSVPHFVSRLDKGTSGLLIAAKSGYVHELLRRALHSDALHREYLALAVGHVTPPRGTISAPIARAEGSLVRRCVAPEGLPSVTEYEVLSHHGALSLVRLAPLTGRTHQLRVHLAHLGYPLAGDWLYGTEDTTLIARPALHSHALSFTHPLTGAPLHFTVPLPEDMARLL